MVIKSQWQGVDDIDKKEKNDNDERRTKISRIRGKPHTDAELHSVMARDSTHPKGDYRHTTRPRGTRHPIYVC